MKIISLFISISISISILVLPNYSHSNEPVSIGLINQMQKYASKNLKRECPDTSRFNMSTSNYYFGQYDQVEGENGEEDTYVQSPQLVGVATCSSTNGTRVVSWTVLTEPSDQYASGYAFSMQKSMYFDPNLKYVSDDDSSEPEQDDPEKVAFIDQIGKDLRRSFWAQGHQDVSGEPKKYDYNNLASYLEEQYEDYLDQDDEDAIKECHENPKCEIYFASISSDYMGGYGVSNSFILLDYENRRYDLRSHMAYAE